RRKEHARTACSSWRLNRGARMTRRTPKLGRPFLSLANFIRIGLHRCWKLNRLRSPRSHKDTTIMRAPAVAASLAKLVTRCERTLVRSAPLVSAGHVYHVFAGSILHHTAKVACAEGPVQRG